MLDLGCGSGREVYVVSKLVGSRGRVIGIDMTDEQLAVARRHVDYHTEKFGYGEPNVNFVKGYMEDLEAAGIASNSVDLVVSNCVTNLSPDKLVRRLIIWVLFPIIRTRSHWTITIRFIQTNRCLFAGIRPIC